MTRSRFILLTLLIIILCIFIIRELILVPDSTERAVPSRETSTERMETELSGPSRTGTTSPAVVPVSYTGTGTLPLGTDLNMEFPTIDAEFEAQFE